MENLLERSSYIQLLDGSVVCLDESSRNLVLEALHDMSTNALRCIGFAYKTDLSELATYDGEDHPAHGCLLDPSNYSSIESDLIFVGLVGLRVRENFVVYYMLLLFLLTKNSLFWVFLINATIIGSSS